MLPPCVQHTALLYHQFCRLVDAKAIYFCSVADLGECEDEEIAEVELRCERIKEKEVSNGC